MFYTSDNRFQNTLRDLLDCQEHLDETLSETEERARQRLIQVCREIGTFAGVSLVAKRPGVSPDRG